MRYLVNHMLGSQRNGLNLVSMNMGDFDRTNGPVRDTNYPTYSDALLNWFQTKNVKSVRLMFTWEAVQRTLGGPITNDAPGSPDPTNYITYLQDLKSVIARLLARDIYVILAPWQFNTASGDTDIVYDDASFTSANFADFWGKFAAAINTAMGNDQRVAFDLINEPHTHAESGNKPGDIGISLTDWFNYAQAAITAIRSAGATNTIFVPGMAYTAASSFTTNGSSTAWLGLTDPQKNIAVSVHCYTGLGSSSPTVLRDACSALVNWARTNGVKVNIGEIAINAGDNKRPTFCSTLPIAQAQWADWTNFCLANNDVLVGWNWWANSAAGNWWNAGDSCDSTSPNHWALTLDDGASQCVYMDVIESSLKVPILYARDDVPDTGAEPNVTTTTGWESLDLWVRQNPDGLPASESIMGGQTAYVYVRVSNRGTGPYPGNANDVVRVYWAKAAAGLSWPQPWNGTIPLQGGPIGGPKPIGAIPAGGNVQIEVNWPSTPRPQDYPGNDGHFCLLAVIQKATSPEFDGFETPDLNWNVLRLSNVVWRNIHIAPAAMMKLGEIIMMNPTDTDLVTQLTFEIPQVKTKPPTTVDPPDPVRPLGSLLITPEGRALEKLSLLQSERPFLEEVGQGTYRVLDHARGIPSLDLAPGEALRFGVQYVPERGEKGYIVRARQLVLDGDSPRVVGGQTFVAGEVEGITSMGEPRRKGPSKRWAVVAGLLLLALLFRRRKKE